MRKEKTFSAFGVTYRTVQFSAAQGFEIIGAKDEELHPCSLLSATEVHASKDIWICLDTVEAINEQVIDAAKVLPPRLALAGVSSLVREFNFGFLSNWKSTKVPSRFIDDARSVSSNHVTPMLSQILQDGVATLKELEEYYSLEDAFKLFDTIMVKGINQALSQEAAIKNSKKR